MLKEGQLFIDDNGQIRPFDRRARIIAFVRMAAPLFIRPDKLQVGRGHPRVEVTTKEFNNLVMTHLIVTDRARQAEREGDLPGQIHYLEMAVALGKKFYNGQNLRRLITKARRKETSGLLG